MSEACPPAPPSGDAGGFTPFPPAAGPAPAAAGGHDSPGAVRALAGLLALGVALALAGLLAWRLIPAVPPAPPRPAVPAVPPSSVEAAMPLVQAQADRWLPGAAPSLISMQVDWPWDDAGLAPGQLPPGGWVNAVFTAPWDAPFGRNARAATLAMLLDRGSGAIVHQSVLPWETPPVQPPAWRAPAVVSGEAQRIAEQAAGREFRRACPEHRHISRLSLLGREAAPFWLADYEDSRAPDQPGLAIRIDAATGDILGVEREAPPCGNEPGAEPGQDAPRPKPGKPDEPAG